jgi:AbrB family looped-hinge helix DNA binding protein
MRHRMTKVTVSPKYQIVIPKEIREGLALSVGETLAVELEGDGLRIHRVKPLEAWFGALKGVKNDFKRDKTDRAL